MTSSDIRSRFLGFFEKRGHTIIPSASLVTTDEKGVTNPTLFNTAGMQPLIPYLLGQPYMKDGKQISRLADSQKCVRTVDIDDIGDKTHATFFEMLGNWSLGDYFKKEAIGWSYEFLTSTSQVVGDEGLGYDEKTSLGIKADHLYVTVFEGDANAPRDDEAAEIWRDIFARNGIDAGGDTSKGEAGRIFFMPADNNWWEAGDNGPCGPDSEMFYDVSDRFHGGVITKDEYLDADEQRDVVEVWNDVFMQYEKKDGKIIGNLPKPSIDTGAGLERLAMVLQGVDNIYDTDLLRNLMLVAASMSGNNLKACRIISDHIRSAVFLVADGVIPSNTGRGYILRRLIRRAIFNIWNKHVDKKEIATFVEILGNNTYSDIYKNISLQKDTIIDVIFSESEQFEKTIHNGLKEFEKMVSSNDNDLISGKDAFILFSTYGFPLEMTKELAKERSIEVDEVEFSREFKAHQALSRAGAEQKFKGGLADANDPMVVRYHTATHLLHQALRDVLGDGVGQKGSNITPERLRFDFSYGAKMTDEEKKRVEDIVNEKIAEKLPVNKMVLPKAEAEKTSARHFFGEKYGDEVSIYFIGKASNPPTIDDINNAYSKEFCGGPHVKNTGELAGPEGLPAASPADRQGQAGKWKFKIKKEEAVSQGVRRIKAMLG